MTSILKIQDLEFTWPTMTKPLLKIKDLSVYKGEKVFLQGASGSGKTTLLNILGGVLKPQSGSVRLLDEDLSSMSEAKRDRFRGDHLGFVFQMFNLLPYLSAFENVTLPCRFSSHKVSRLGGSWDQVEDEAWRLLSELKLNPDKFKHKLSSEAVTQFSVGQQQRIATARALMGRPEIVIADEPTSALDAQVRESFLKLLFEECCKYGTTLIFVSHDLSLGSLFDRNIKLSEINLASAGSLKTEELL